MKVSFSLAVLENSVQSLTKIGVGQLHYHRFSCMLLHLDLGARRYSLKERCATPFFLLCAFMSLASFE